MEGPGIRILNPGDEGALECFLLDHLASSMFLLGNMRAAGLVDRGERYQGTYAAALEGGRVAGAVAHYWNGNLITQAPAHLAALCSAAVKASGRPIRGMLGPEAQVSALEAELDINRDRMQLDESQKLFSLELESLRVPDALQTGQLVARRAEPRDLELLIDWRVSFAIETLGDSDAAVRREAYRDGVVQVLRERRAWVLEDGGRVVAYSAFNTATREAAQIGGVWTPPEWRRRGYGRAVVAASLVDARAEGIGLAILFTGEGNLPAQRAYEALGFEYLGRYRVVLLREDLWSRGPWEGNRLC
jgi:ribosomal protein S18 acetylase RimI-like enzyme